MNLTAIQKTPRTANIISIFFLLFLPFLFFWRETLGWLTLGDKDAVFWFYPAYKFVAEQLKAGQLPLLTPYLYCGSPLLAEWQAGVFDPINWIYLLGVTSRTLTLTLQLTFAIAMIAMFSFARSLGLDPRAGLVAAIIYGLSGFAVGRTIYPGFLHIFALAPWALFFTERLYRRGRWRDAAAGALIVAWQVFAAHPQPLLYSSLLVCVYALYRAFFRDASDLGGTGNQPGSLKNFRASIVFLAKFSLLYLAGVGLAAVQLIPAAEFARESVRREWPFELFTLHSLHPVSLATTLFPFFHGEGKGIFEMAYWGPYWHNNEVQIYLGVIALSLAMAAGITAWRSGPRVARFWTLAAIAGAILSLGKYSGPIAKLLFHVPVIGQFRSPNRHWMEVTLAVAVLAGVAVDRLLKEESKALAGRVQAAACSLALLCLFIGGLVLAQPELAERIIRSSTDLDYLPAGFLKHAGLEFSLPIFSGLAGAIVLVVFARSGRRAKWSALLPIVMLVDFNLYAAYAPINNPAKLETLVGRAMPAALAEKQQPHDPIRYHIMLDAVTGEFNPFWFYGHEMSTGYDPLLSQQVKAFLGVDEAGRTYNTSMLQPQDRTLDLANVRYLFVRGGSEAPADASRWREISDRSPVLPYRDFRIFENLRALPRAWLVDRVEVAWEGDQHKMIRGQIAGFDPGSMALVEPISEPKDRWYRDFEKKPADHSSSPDSTRAARIIERRPDRLIVETESAKPAILILSELARPGWKASVDGRQEPWYRVDFLLRAIPVREGKHTVEFVYAPASLKIGAVVSLTTALGLLILFFVERRGLKGAGAPA